MHKHGYDEFSVFDRCEYDRALKGVARGVEHDFELVIRLSKKLEHILRSSLPSCNITGSGDYEQMGLTELIKLHEKVLHCEAEFVAYMVRFTKCKCSESHDSLIAETTFLYYSLLVTIPLVRNKVVHDHRFDHLLDDERRFVLEFEDEYGLRGTVCALQSKNDFEKVIRATKSLKHFLQTKISSSNDKWKPNLKTLIDQVEHDYSPNTIEDMRLIKTSKCLLLAVSISANILCYVTISAGRYYA